MERLSPDGERSGAWKWQVCGLLFLATMIMYLDRQTLAQTIARISDELHLTNAQYGQLEKGFGLAFAVGAIVLGLIADRVNVRWMYPLVLVGWSSAGIATAYGAEIGYWLTDQFPWLVDSTTTAQDATPASQRAFIGFWICRVALGFFEAGHWPCALITTQRLLTPQDRTFGNSLLQSGASIGAILTPLAVLLLMTPQSGTWRRPFVLVGIVGMLWVPAWLWLVRGQVLRKPAPILPAGSAGPSHGGEGQWLRRFVTLLIVVIAINMTWQFLRAWQAKMLADQYGRSERFVQIFSSAFYLIADVGCLLSGWLVKRATVRGWGLSHARVAVFAGCALLTALTTVAAKLPTSQLPLFLTLLVVIGCGSLGLFPIYYSLAQDISTARLGLISGMLSFSTWTVTAFMQEWVGKNIDATNSYDTGLFWSGLLPLAGVAALVFLWPKDNASPAPADAETHPADADQAS